jgi:tetratricopeptide (TPR) repeat protein
MRSKKRGPFPRLLKIRFFAGTLLFGGLVVLGWGGCSSAPKRPAAVFVIRNMAETQLELANIAADQGRYNQALAALEEARRLAISVDDPGLLIRSGLSQGNALFSLGRAAEAAGVWEAALAEALRAGEGELAALTRIHIARSRLLSDSAGPGTAAEVKAQVTGEIGVIKTDKLAIALGWIVIGLAEKEERRWADAETAVKKALEIHEKDNYLGQAAYDWFLIASIRSGSGQYAAAVEALEKAIGFDRRAENSYALGMDWRAVGDVQKKAARAPEAAAAYGRSLEIFRSLGFEAEAATVESRLNP